MNKKTMLAEHRRLMRIQPRATEFVVGLEMFEAVEFYAKPIDRFVVREIAERGYQNIQPGLFSSTFILDPERD